MRNSSDLIRLKNEYSDRAKRLGATDKYSSFNPANLFILQSRQRAVLSLLRQYGFKITESKQVIEVGCGSGGVLLEYLSFGFNPSCLHGIDILNWRILEAHSKLPHIPLICADAQKLPYLDHSFDLVLQYTAFSSILDMSIKRTLAEEMLRVLKPNGLILWYDFWINPTNPQTRGIRPAEIRSLFPGCNFDFNRITLAPPLARRLVPISWVFAFILEKLILFNTHYLVAIRP